MKRILVPFDFSEPAINAFRFALDVAAQSSGAVHLLNVIELPALPNTAFTPVRALGVPLRREMSEKVRNGFEKVVAKYKKDGVDIVSNVDFGVPSKVILTYAKKNSMDIIFMGSHGASGLREVLVGSNTEKIVRTSPVPVIVVKEFYKGPVSKIVFPCTVDTANQDDLVQEVKALQAFFKSTLHVVWINTPANFASDTITIKRLKDFARKFAIKNFVIDVFNHINEEEGILQYAKSINADMIAMGTHGRRGLAHFMHGSLTENVVNHGKTLLWTYVMNN